MSKERTRLTGGRSRGLIAVQRLARSGEVTRPQIVRAAKAVLGKTPVRSLNIVLVDGADMAVLHERFMGEPGPTDVLAFDLRDDNDRPEIDGEVIVCMDVARQQARKWRACVTEEVLRYVIHGLLHLLGYDDRSPAGRRRMRREENRVLAAIEPRSNRHA